MDTALTELVRISKAVGSDSSLVLGSFGNTSVKTEDDKYMYIKASGTVLKDMTGKIGWRRLKIAPVLAIMKDKSIAEITVGERESKVAESLLFAADDNIAPDIKPSIESCFHSILDRYVIHLHPVMVLAYACAENGRQELQKLFQQEKTPPVWVPYANIGYPLAKKIQKLVYDYKNRYDKKPEIMFLQNHGLVVTANDSDTALRLVRKVVNICSSRLKLPKPLKIKTPDNEAINQAAISIHDAFFRTTGEYATVTHFIDENITRFMTAKNAAQLCAGAAVTPDELVYSHGPAMWLDKCDVETILNKLNRLYPNRQELPCSVLVRSLGLFIIGNNQPEFVKDVVGAYFTVRSFAAQLGGIHPLNRQQCELITRQQTG